jgi:hypothetical protein
MATSGVKTYTVTTQQLIKDAFVEATIYRQGASLPAEDYDFALRKLNTLARAWQSRGFNVWNDRRATLFLGKSDASYTLGSAGDHATESFVSTTLSADAASGAGTVTVTSATGISNGDYIGIVKDDGELFWTTINGAPAGTTITLTVNLDGDAASGNTVFTYTTKITKPLEVTNVQLRQGSNNSVNMYRLERENYFELSNREATGTPNQFYYERRRVDGVLYIWTTPQDVTQYINFTYQPYLDDFINQADEADFPIEWQRALVMGLASELCTPFGIGAETYQKVTSKAQYWMDMATGNDNENGTLTFDVSDIWQ